MHEPDEKAGDRPRHWNANAGGAWVEAQASIDRMFEPLEHLLVDAIAAGAPRRVLDVGCGTGGTTLATARRLGANAQCVGVDIAERGGVKPAVLRATVLLQTGLAKAAVDDDAAALHEHATPAVRRGVEEDAEVVTA